MVETTGTKKLFSREDIRAILLKSDRAVERAMLCLYDRQTQDEQSSSITRYSNQRGFSGAHSIRGSYYARWVLSGKALSGVHLQKARKIALSYARQLAEVANTKD